MSTVNRNRNKSIQVLERCFTIMEEIARQQGETSLNNLHKQLNIPHSTIHRVLSSLIQLGYVEQNMDNGRYRLGLKILPLSGTVLENLDLRKVGKSYLRGLTKELREASHLAVLDHDEVVFIERTDYQESEKYSSPIGHRASVHATAAGKILLSEMAHQDIIDILRKKGMPAFTIHTVTDVETFIDQLATVRKSGYALDNEEAHLGKKCLAGPVRNHTGRIFAAISITGPAARLTPERIREIAPIIQKYGMELSVLLGFSEEAIKLSM